ncbi:AbrB family transcriptional regulator [Pseudorhodoplanes sp.]|jgi:membrane AbrB-like protein|uniref:AbrB family transcriptional regulator n=1 Tax=Pseudorhodoplanes sp. TaxID=1934341 RepID=UPI002B95D447|nr:AbrB family transcriptional regulator [Pseudorhodoplanes sp.]HWV42029.1 AbrB family transcriptional regulator [Pseudorhodoplanes sp.]
MALPSRQTVLNLGETLLAGTIGGALLTYAGIPAGWLSGSMIAIAIAALAGRPMGMPAPLGRVVFVLIGISLGGAVTPETLKGVSTWPLSVVLLCAAMTCAMFGSALYLKKVHGWDMLSGLFGSAPGALSQVMAYATQYHSDLRGIAIVQTIRVVILTALLPVGLALFGLIPAAPPARGSAATDSPLEIGLLVLISSAAAIVAHYVRFPGGLIFGAMLASAILHGSGLIHASMPWWLVSAVMVCLGAITGSRFANTELRLLFRHFFAALGSFSVSLLIVAVFAAVAAFTVDLNLPDVVVSYAPGALDAMMILALALHLDPIFVGAHHVARFMLISAALPLFVRIYGQTPPPPPSKPPEKRPVQED